MKNAQPALGSLLACALFAWGCAASGCALFFPSLGPHDPIPAATRQEHEKCGAEPVDARIYGADLVESVAPHYFYVPGGPNGTDARIGGAELRLRPLPGITAELLTRQLMCRSARLVLGHAKETPNEPYWLPDGWVKIDVRSSEGSFVVTLDGEDDPHAREILARAKAFTRR